MSGCRIKRAQLWDLGMHSLLRWYFCDISAALHLKAMHEIYGAKPVAGYI
jgi:hypothetical protein